MLLGTYEHSLDTKNRLVIPSKLMEELRGKLYIYPATDNSCIKLYAEEEWLRYRQKIDSLPPAQSYAAKALIYPSAQQVVPDAQNRIPVPAKMLERVGIAGKNIVTLGMDDFCEIWDAEKHKAKEAVPPSEETLALLSSMGF